MTSGPNRLNTGKKWALACNRGHDLNHIQTRRGSHRAKPRLGNNVLKVLLECARWWQIHRSTKVMDASSGTRGMATRCAIERAELTFAGFRTYGS